MLACDAQETKTFILRNIGGKALTFGEMSISGRDADAFKIVSQTTPKTLTYANDRTQISVEFTPRNDRSYVHRATLHIPSSDATPETTLDLKGTGPSGTNPSEEADTDPSQDIDIGCANASLLMAPAFDDTTAPEQIVVTEQSLSYTAPEANVSADDDFVRSVIYSAALEGGDALPSWMSFDPATRMLSGTPARANADERHTVVVTATYAHLTEAEREAHFATHTVPVRVRLELIMAPAFDDTTAPEQVVVTGQSHSYTAPEAKVSADDNAARSVVYSAVLEGGAALPAWLLFDATTRTLSGTPQRVDAGPTLHIEVRATLSGLSAAEQAEYSGTHTVPIRVRVVPTDCTATPVEIGLDSTSTGTWTADADCAVYTFNVTEQWGRMRSIELRSPGTPVDLHLHKGTATTGIPMESSVKWIREGPGRSLRQSDHARLVPKLIGGGRYTMVVRYSDMEGFLYAGNARAPTPPLDFTLRVNIEVYSGGVHQDFSGCTAPALSEGTRVVKRFAGSCTSLHRIGQQALYWTIDVPDPGVGRAANVEVTSCSNPSLWLRPGAFPTETDRFGRLRLGGVYGQQGETGLNTDGCSRLHAYLVHRDGESWQSTYVIEAAKLEYGRTSASISMEWTAGDECVDCAPTISDVEASRLNTACLEANDADASVTLPKATGGNGNPDRFIYRILKRGESDEFRENGLKFDADTRSIVWDTAQDGTPTALTHDVTYEVHDADGDRRSSDRYTKDFVIEVKSGTGGNTCTAGLQQGLVPRNNYGPGFPQSVYDGLLADGGMPNTKVGKNLEWVGPEALDPNDGDTLSYTMTLANGGALPAWLTFDAATRTLSGTPGETGTVELSYTASDSGTPSLSTALVLTLTVGEGEAAGLPELTMGVGVDAARGGDIALAATLTPSGTEGLSIAWAISGASHDALLALDDAKWVEGETGEGRFLVDPGAVPATFRVPKRRDVTNRAALDDGQWLDFTLTVGNGTGETVSGTVRATIAGSTWGTVAMSIADGAAEESAGAVDFAVTLSGAAWSAVSARWTVEAGSATANRDYPLGTGGTVTFAAGETVKTVSVPIIADGLDEGPETFMVTLSSPAPAGAVTLARVKALGVIGRAPTPGMANAGADIAAKRGATMALAGSGTAQAGGSQALRFRWRVAAASHADLSWRGPNRLSNADTANAAYAVPRRGEVTDRTAVDDGAWVDLELTVTDGDGRWGIDTTRLTINGSAPEVQAPTPNRAPRFPQAAAAQTAVEGKPFSYEVPEATDADSDPLAYTAALASRGALPAWLAFDAETRTFSGTPGTGDAPAALSVEVTATDDATPALSASTSFTLTVEEAPTPPQADAGADFKGKRGEELTLSGVGTPHAEGSQALTYLWTIEDASNDELKAGSRWLTNAAQATATYTVPRRRDVTDRRALDDGQWIDFALTVTDGDGDAGADILRMTIEGSLWKVVYLSVADAEVDEGTGPVEFTVALSEAAIDDVTVAYATADGTATAGADYAATSGTLTFVPGETAKTVRVPVHDDAHDEGTETFTLALSDPRPAAMAKFADTADAVATGSIKNADPLPRAWTARFGRSVAVHVVDALDERLRLAPSESWARLAGHQLGGGPDVHETLRRLVPDPDAGSSPGQALRADGGAADPGGRAMTFRDLLLGSAFHLVSNDGDQATGPRLSAWGRAAASGFDGQTGGLSLDGTVTTAALGVDGAWQRWLTGLILAYSEGEGSFVHADLPGGDLASTLTSAHPYVAYALGDRVRLWGMAGYGSGSFRLRLEDERVLATDLTLVMGALGVRGSLLDPSRAGGFALTLRSDAMWMVMDSAAADNLAATEADASRMRLVLEGSRPVNLAAGGSFTPSLEIGLRRDGGDAETGTGVEVGGSLLYATAWGLSVEASVRGLLAHEASDYSEWGASGALRFDPGRQGKGLNAAVMPAWGTASTGVQRLWEQAQGARLVADNALAATAAGRLEAELGYGLGTFQGRGLLTPYARVQLVENADRAWHLGTRLALAESLDLRVEAGRRQRAGDVAANEVALRATLGW